MRFADGQPGDCLCGFGLLNDQGSDNGTLRWQTAMVGLRSGARLLLT
jgi:hypothetical protein